jgi:hypothetical protein
MLPEPELELPPLLEPALLLVSPPLLVVPLLEGCPPLAISESLPPPQDVTSTPAVTVMRSKPIEARTSFRLRMPDRYSNIEQRSIAVGRVVIGSFATRPTAERALLTLIQ